MDVVAVGTLALAASTAYLALATRRIASATRDQVDRAYRPVIVPASGTEEISFRRGRVSEAAAGPTMLQGKLVLPVENVGMGPAMNVSGNVVVLAGGSIWGTGFVQHPVEGIAARTANAVLFTPHEGQLEVHPELRARLLYYDVAGSPYWTQLHYNEGERGYRCEVHEGTPPGDPEPEERFF